MMQLRCVVVYGESARRNAKTIWPVLKALRDGDKPMKYTVTISRILLGLISVVFSLKGFLHFIPPPKFPDVAGQFLGAIFQSPQKHDSRNNIPPPCKHSGWLVVNSSTTD